MPVPNRAAAFPLPGVFIRIGLSVLVIGLLNLSPTAAALTEGLQAAQQALANQAPRTALRHLAWVLVHEPWRGPDLWRMVGQTALAAGDPQAASEALLHLAAENLAKPADWLALGDAAWQLAAYQEAVTHWQQAVNATPAGAGADAPGTQAARRIVDYFRERSQYASEVTALQQMLSLHPTQAAYVRLGVLLTMDDRHAAVSALEAAEKFNGEESDVALAGSAARLKAGIRTALLFDEPAYTLLQCGRALGAEGYWEFAYYAFYEAVQLRPDVGEGWAYLAEAGQQAALQGGPVLMENQLIKTWLEQAYQLAPESLAVNAFLGLYWLRQDAGEQALPFLRQAAQLDPANPLWLQTIGAALAVNGDVHAAQAAYREAVELDPGNADAWRVLAAFHLHYEIQLETEGLVAAQRAVSLDPDNPANQDAAGLALLLLGRGAEAEAYFQAALALDPAYAPALLHLGGLYLDSGRTEEAAIFLARAQEQAGAHPGVSLTAADARRLQVWLSQGLDITQQP